MEDLMDESKESVEEIQQAMNLLVGINIPEFHREIQCYMSLKTTCYLLDYELLDLSIY